MKNKEITIYELIGLIKDNNAPKEIRIDNKIWYLYKSNKGISYIDNEKTYLKSCSLNFNYYIEENKLNDTVEILSEENDEWEDIEFEDCSLIFSEKDLDISFRNFSRAIMYNKELIEQLIKNQKYLREKLESKDELR